MKNKLAFIVFKVKIKNKLKLFFYLKPNES